MITKIKARRFLAQRTQDDIYLITGIPQSRISKIERGYIQPKSEEVEALSKVLNCKPEDLMT